MGHDVSQEQPGWLPGELEALMAMEPPAEDEVTEDDLLTGSDRDESDWKDCVRGADFGWNIEAETAVDAEGEGESRLRPAASDQSVPARVSAALARLQAAADELAALAIDPALGLAGSDELIGWTQELERCRNTLQVPEQSLINLMEAAGCRIDGPVGLFATPHGFLSALLGIQVGEAKARVRAADLLAPKVGMSGVQVPARYPLLAAAQSGGELSRDRVEQVTKALADWEKLLGVADSNVTPDTLAEVDGLLASQARVFGGRDLGRVIDRVGAWLVPDGMLDDRPAQDAARGLEVHPIQRGMHRGMYRVEGRLTAEAGAKMSAVLDPLSKPQPIVDEVGRVVEPDHRDRAARLHDGLEEVMDRCLRSGELPAHGGTPTTLILLAEEDDFVSAAAAYRESAPGSGAGERAGSGAVGSGQFDHGAKERVGRVCDGPPGSAITETGDVLPIEMAIALSDEAEIVRTVFDKKTGDVLKLGRTRRLASYAQTLALAARDGGCTFPGCGKSPKWCQRHHIVDWVKGGPTDLENLTLLCSFHHYRFARHGWSAEYQQGRVWWRPPKIIDPDQKPILNLRRRDYPLIT